MKTFKAITKDKTEIELKFVEPTAKVLTEASKLYNTTFATLLDSGALLRKRLAAKLKEQGLWSEEQQVELDRVQKDLIECEHRLHQGGMKLSEGKELAISIAEKRTKQGELLSSYNEYDNTTIEGQADNARFNYFVFSCTVYTKNEQRYFKTYDDFASYADPVAFVCASKYAKEYYNFDENFESSLPENKFLKQYGFVDDSLRLINSDGDLVNEDGDRVNEFGNKVDDSGNIVDNFGYIRTDKGEFADEQSPFFDDDGKPIAVDSDDKTNEVESVDTTELADVADSA